MCKVVSLKARDKSDVNFAVSDISFVSISILSNAFLSADSLVLSDFAILIYLYACKSHAIDSLVQVYQLPDPETNIMVSHRTKTPYV